MPPVDDSTRANIDADRRTLPWLGRKRNSRTFPMGPSTLAGTFAISVCAWQRLAWAGFRCCHSLLLQRLLSLLVSFRVYRNSSANAMMDETLSLFGSRKIVVVGGRSAPQAAALCDTVYRMITYILY
jgi:hypothetical protein